MISRELREAVAPRQRTLNLIWGAFLAATLFYVAVVWFTFRSPAPAGDAGTAPLDPWLMTIALALAAFLTAVGSFVLPRTLLTPAKVARVVMTGSGTAPTAAETAALPRLPESEGALLQLLPAYQTSLIIVWAMREAIAVYGVVLAIAMRQPAAMVPFVVVAFALVAVARPRTTEFLEGTRGRA